jgi:alpha-beta hydrolase superfamily lysophospholipase
VGTIDQQVRMAEASVLLGLFFPGVAAADGHTLNKECLTSFFGNSVVLAVVAAAAAALIVWVAHRLGPRPPEPRRPELFPDVEVPTWSNRPRPRDFFVSSSRGERIYYELHGVAPSSPGCRGLIFVNSGYSAHMMRPTCVPLLQALADAGFAVATHDWSGHGYSEGLRCAVDPPLMLQDYEQFVDLILGSIGTLQPTPGGIAPRNNQGGKAATTPTRTTRARAKQQRGGNLPWYVCGQSMGGGLTCVFAQRVWAEILGRGKKAAAGGAGKAPPLLQQYGKFGGWVGVASFVEPDSKPPPLVFAVMQAVARFFPRHLIPSAIAGVGIPDEFNWPTRELIAWHMTHDLWGVPGGLGWGKGMRWSSAAAFFQLADRIRTATDGGSSIAFPLLLCHDPDDRVVSFSGSQLLYDRAATDPALKVLKRFDGGLHDLIGNKGEAIARHICEWADAAATAAAGAARE